MHDALGKSRNDLIFWTSNDQFVAQVELCANSCTMDNMIRTASTLLNIAQHCSTLLNIAHVLSESEISEALAQHFQVTRRNWPLQLHFLRFLRL